MEIRNVGVGGGGVNVKLRQNFCLLVLFLIDVGVS